MVSTRGAGASVNYSEQLSPASPPRRQTRGNGAASTVKADESDVSCEDDDVASEAAERSKAKSARKSARVQGSTGTYTGTEKGKQKAQGRARSRSGSTVARRAVSTRSRSSSSLPMQPAADHEELKDDQLQAKPAAVRRTAFARKKATRISDDEKEADPASNNLSLPAYTRTTRHQQRLNAASQESQDQGPDRNSAHNIRCRTYTSSGRLVHKARASYKEVSTSSEYEATDSRPISCSEKRPKSTGRRTASSSADTVHKRSSMQEVDLQSLVSPRAWPLSFLQFLPPSLHVLAPSVGSGLGACYLGCG